MTNDPTATAAFGPWRPANNGAGRRMWFLHRDAPEIMDRYRWDARERLIRYGSHAAAVKAAERLNRATPAPGL